MATVERGTVEANDRELEAAQAAYLERCAPGYRTRRVRWSGGSTQMIEMGEGDPILLIHGGMGEAFQWGSILSPLAQGRRVLAVDRPGHGLADPFDYRGVDLLRHAREFVGEIMDAEGLASAPIVATSMGGLWGVAFALEHPERVPRLVLVGAPAGIMREQPLMLRLGTLPLLKTIVRGAMRKPTRKSTHDFWKQLLVAHPENLPDDLLDLLTLSQARNCESWFTLIDRSFDIRGMKPELLFKDRWRELSMPTAFIWGERDAYGSPSIAEAIAATNPHMRVVRVPDAGHAPWIDQPEIVVREIERALDE